MIHSPFLRPAGLLLRVMAAESDADGIVRRRQRELAAACGKSVRHVQRLLQVLQQHGSIEWVRRGYKLCANSDAITRQDCPITTEMSYDDENVVTRQKCPTTTKMSPSATENQQFALTQNSLHKENARASAAAAADSSKSPEAAAISDLAPILEVLKPHIANAQRIAQQILANCRKQFPPVSGFEVAKLLQPEMQAAWERYQQKKIISLPAVLMAWSKNQFSGQDVQRMREEARAAELKQEQQRQQQEAESQRREAEWRAARELEEAWNSLPNHMREPWIQQCREELFASTPRARSWPPSIVESTIRMKAMLLWSESTDSS